MLQTAINDNKTNMQSGPGPDNAGPVAAIHPRLTRAARSNQAALRQIARGHSAPLVQRTCACGGAGGSCSACEEKKEAVVHRRARHHGDAGAVPPVVNDVLRSPGQPLDRGIRASMEARLGHDFSQVRVHTDARASRSARAVDALAYTVGHNVVFDAGHYAPGTAAGQKLIAHELVHVVQQAGSLARSSPAARISSPLDPAEVEAERAADSVLAGSALPAVRATAELQRYSHNDCSDADLRAHVWPSDGIAKAMVAKAIRVLSASPINSAVTPLLTKHFRGTSNVAAILGVYNRIQADLTADDYTYECEDDCDETQAAYVRHRLRYLGYSPNIHLCMNHIRGYANDCTASLIVHEFSHYSAHTADGGCMTACSTVGCPATMSADDAVDNSYSYANFAYELNPMAV